MGKKVKKDEKTAPDDVFSPLLVESKQAATVVLMLDSPEEDVLAKACEAIYKFVDKCDENRKTLLDLGAVDKMVRLIQLDDRIIRRNACMCVGVMTAHPEVRRELRKKDAAIPTLLHLLGPEEETIVNEFAALALSHMCNEFSSKVVVFDNGGVEVLLRCLSSSDPDVQKNSMETLALMMQDYHSRAAVREHDGFPPILELLKSEFAIIQELALVAITRAAIDAENRAVLRDLQALNLLVNFVGKPQYNDLHVHALHALSNCLEDHESMKRIKDNGGLARLIAFIIDRTPPVEESVSGGKKDKKKSGKGKKGQQSDDAEDKKTGTPSFTLPEVKRHACRAIARAAQLADNRKLLHEQEVEKMLITLLGHEDNTVQVAAALALGVMAESMSSRESVATLGGIEPLVKLMKPDNGDLREAVTLALANLTEACNNNCSEIMAKNGIELLINLLGDTREYVVANAASVLTNMAVIENIRAEIQRLGVISALISPLKSESAMVQNRAATATAAFVTEAETRHEFREAGGLPPLVELLKSNDDNVRRSACWAVTIVAVDRVSATELCRLGALEVLHDIQTSTTRHNRFTEAAMTKLLDSNLPAKYALTGYLDYTDQIEDGFYDVGQLRLGAHFMTLEEYCKAPLNQKRPVLLINSKIPPDLASDQYSSRNSPASSKPTSANSRTELEVTVSHVGKKGRRKQQEQKKPEQEEEKEETQEEPHPVAFAPPGDLNFARYVEEVREKILPINRIKEQIITLAEFVSDRLGGSIDRGQVSNFSYELAISQLKLNLESNVIPIGLITAGIHYHRALLFKALADRTAIPCNLVRGEYNRAWNEVMLVENDEATPGSPAFPPKCFIVDLIYHPGNLMRTDSVGASNYQKI